MEKESRVVLGSLKSDGEVGPYEILEKKGTNTYKLVDQEGDIEDLIHAEHLKP